MVRVTAYNSLNTCSLLSFKADTVQSIENFFASLINHIIISGLVVDKSIGKLPNAPCQALI